MGNFPAGGFARLTFDAGLSACAFSPVRTRPIFLSREGRDAR